MAPGSSPTSRRSGSATVEADTAAARSDRAAAWLGNRGTFDDTMASRDDLLVTAGWLAEHLEDPAIRVLECTVYLHPADVPGGYRVESGRARWAQGHIPGAGFVDLQDELSDRTSPLRFMLPPAAQLAEAMGRHGVGDGVHVVLYDRFVNMWAARVWWMLRAFGFDGASVLDGGWK